MTRAAQQLAILSFTIRQLVAAVAAGIDQPVQLSGLVPGHDHWCVADKSREYIAGIGQLLNRRKELPGSPEDSRHLEIEDRFIRVGVQRETAIILQIVPDGVEIQAQ